MFFLYDWNRVFFRKRRMSHLFAARNVCLVVVTIRLARLFRTVRFGGWLLWFMETAVLLVFLICTLYLTLPSNSIYCKKADLRTVYRNGMYDWCRHPDIWWFLGCSSCLDIFTSLGERMILYLVLSLLNLLYAWCQDRCIFVVEFPDYEDYKRTVPFLIPNFVQSSRGR